MTPPELQPKVVVLGQCLGDAVGRPLGSDVPRRLGHFCVGPKGQTAVWAKLGRPLGHGLLGLLGPLGQLGPPWATAVWAHHSPAHISPLGHAHSREHTAKLYVRIRMMRPRGSPF